MKEASEVDRSIIDLVQVGHIKQLVQYFYGLSGVKSFMGMSVYLCVSIITLQRLKRFCSNSSCLMTLPTSLAHSL